MYWLIIYGKSISGLKRYHLLTEVSLQNSFLMLLKFKNKERKKERKKEVFFEAEDIKLIRLLKLLKS